MTEEKLVRMANQIAAFFHAYPEPQAIAGIRDHLRAFWTPAMRDAALVHLRAGAAGFDPLVIAALRALETPDSILAAPAP